MFLDIPHQNEIKKSEEIDKYRILMNLNAKINTHQTKRTPSAALLWRQLSWFPIQETTFFRLFCFYLVFLRHLLLPFLLLLFTKSSGQKSAAKNLNVCAFSYYFFVPFPVWHYHTGSFTNKNSLAFTDRSRQLLLGHLARCARFLGTVWNGTDNTTGVCH